MASKVHLTGVERTFAEDEIIVSKTDLKGRITYANRVFLRVSQYTEAELLGKPHNIVRHPAMPRCVFKFLWDNIQAGNEVFAYVLNRAKSGDHYWVFAHITPTFNDAGEIISYHSNRRVPSRAALQKVKPVYDALLREEQKYRTPREQWEASLPMLVGMLEKAGMSYEEFVFTLA
ncbi:MAG: PAS domain-containing protein [Phycisphaerales bacterium]|nr:PAS domain-containing protein [Phycisphaerales bacterium]